ncbi:MAG: helix-turn-helix domain-containing protein [Candidatus Woesearchaeota archaeon]
MPNYVTPKELHERTGIKLHRIYQWCKRSDFPAVRAGRTYIILKDRFEEWMLKQAYSE